MVPKRCLLMMQWFTGSTHPLIATHLPGGAVIVESAKEKGQIHPLLSESRAGGDAQRRPRRVCGGGRAGGGGGMPWGRGHRYSSAPHWLPEILRLASLAQDDSGMPAGAARPRQGASGADDQRLRLSAATRATVASGVSPRLAGSFRTRTRTRTRTREKKRAREEPAPE